MYSSVDLPVLNMVTGKYVFLTEHGVIHLSFIQYVTGLPVGTVAPSTCH